MRRRRIGRPPHTHQWTPEQDEIVRTLGVAQAAEKLGIGEKLIRER